MGSDNSCSVVAPLGACHRTAYLNIGLTLLCSVSLRAVLCSTRIAMLMLGIETGAPLLLRADSFVCRQGSSGSTFAEMYVTVFRKRRSAECAKLIPFPNTKRKGVKGRVLRNFAQSPLFGITLTW